MNNFRLSILFIIAFFKFTVCEGQICSGTTTVVWKDDFGSGTPQLATQPSPNITSGYTFENNGVDPGHYALVNRYDYFNSWHRVPEDHTPGDTNGYFLVIDGNPGAPVFYETVVNDVCPFTQYSFATAAMNIDLPQFNSDQTFTFIISDLSGNQLATWSSPPVTVTNEPIWVPLGFNFNSGSNTSLKLQVQFNSTGYDDFAFDDFQFSVCGPLLSITSNAPNCGANISLSAQLGTGYANPVFQWQKKNDAGQFIDIPGATLATFTDLNPADTNNYRLFVGDGALSCAITRSETIITKAVKRTDVNKSICQGESFAGYTATGIYVDSFVAQNGCDSVRTLYLNVSNCTNTSTVSGIINDYTAVTTINFCNNKLMVEDDDPFNVGDTVLLIQMKGAVIDDRNSVDFGTIFNNGTAGTYEFNYVKSKLGNQLELSNVMLNVYDAQSGRVQLVRVPYYQTANITATVTCPAWDGKKGGIVVLNSANEITMNAAIDVNGKGFRGGLIGAGFSCGNISSWAAPTGTGGSKGEGIADYVVGLEAGGARLANGGGGAYAANTGGGGGANFGAGGIGGKQSNTCPSATQSIGGQAMDYTAGNRLFAGGGGGGGQQDDGQPVAAGGAGGGIVIIKAATLNANNQTIFANGEDVTTLVRDEGGAGGGAGGSILFYVNSYSGTVQVQANGGGGSSNDNIIYPSRCHGPGGGGGGGYIGYSNAAIFPGISTSLNGGKAGLILNNSSVCFNTTHGAADGISGGTRLNLSLPVATIPFVKNIDSVTIKDSASACKSFVFAGIAFTNTGPIQNWQWTLGDNTSAASQQINHTYGAAGSYTVKLVATDANGCQDSVIKIVTPAGINFDFVQQQNICNPLLVQFRAVGDTTPEIFWSFGDGSIINNIRNPTHAYSDTGFYDVAYSTGNGLCVDTIKKSIYIGFREGNIIMTPDTTICFGTNKLLRSNIDSSLAFCWSPGTSLNNVNFANPTTSTLSNVTYSLLSESASVNLVTNGNFTSGNVSFTNEFVLNNAGGILSSGEYNVSNSGINAGVNAVQCSDHTNQAGNMLVVNSAGSNKKLWQQTVAVSPNTNYLFSGWIQSLNASGSGILRFTINGNTVLDSILLSNATCNWNRYAVVWNSGNHTSAQLSLNDITIQGVIVGRDNFAIDDISFSAYRIQQEQIIITVDTPSINTRADTTVCQSVSVNLLTTGAAIYSWSPVTGLSNSSIASPEASPSISTKYYVTGTNSNGCSAVDSVSITILPKPFVTTTGDTSICRNSSFRLFASGGITYAWTPTATLTNITSATPLASPIANTIYRVVVTGNNNCVSVDSVKVDIIAIPSFTISPDKTICKDTRYQLNASGGNRYTWSPASMVSNAFISNPLANSSNSTQYTVIIQDTVCGYKDTLLTMMNVLPLPIIMVSKENDINCAVGTVQLTASGGLQYAWTPANGLNDAVSYAPVASPLTTTRYTVKGSDINGCFGTATVTVIVDLTGKATYELPNAFSPNGDSKNDCFKIKYFGQVSALELVIYNRFGNQVFRTNNPNDCWDGYYNGNPAEPGNYVYHLKATTACGPVEKKGSLLLIR